ncbi:MAG: aminotransferase class V-fold PLP-dependent enzyme [Betaproteobacteria bacterium]|nr:aminotransferase class V-fold PLP-dependent enzyme [Betaproteobacteria bacterium]
MSTAPIYLDYNATTPIAREVLEAMLPYLATHFGNPSSQHGYGAPAHAAVEAARSQVAHLVGGASDEIVFTSGGTEATNHALKGLAFAQTAGERRRIVVSAVEHPATLETARALQRFGFEVVDIGADRHGVIDLAQLKRALSPQTLAVSLMHANNETGTVQPVAAAAEAAHRHGALLHVDAAQSAGKIAVDVNALGADLLTLAGHKLYAPKGVGALYVRSGIVLEPLIHGAGQESGRRAGTENVPYIVALGAACRIARERLEANAAHMAAMRDRLWTQLHTRLGERAVLNGHPQDRLPNTLNVSFAGCVGSELLAALPQLAASTGSACHDGRISISPVLAAMGVDPMLARGAVRFSVGRDTSVEEIDQAAAMVAEYVLSR